MARQKQERLSSSQIQNTIRRRKTSKGYVRTTKQSIKMTDTFVGIGAKEKYLHSYAENFYSSFNAQSLKDDFDFSQQIDSIFDTFIKRKEADFKNFCALCGVTPEEFLNIIRQMPPNEVSLTGVIKEIGEVFDSKSGEAIKRIQEVTDQIIMSNEMMNGITDKLKKYFSNRAREFSGSKTDKKLLIIENGEVTNVNKALTPTAIKKIKVAVIDQLRNGNENDKRFARALDALTTADSSEIQAFAGLVGLSAIKLGGKIVPIGNQMIKNYADFMENQLKTGGKKNMIGYIVGAFGEKITQENLEEQMIAEFAEYLKKAGLKVSVVGTGTLRGRAGTVKSDVTIEIRNANSNELVDFLGVSAKTYQFKKYTTKDADSPRIAPFKIQDMKVSSLENYVGGLRSAKLDSCLGILGDAVDRIYYAIINQEFFYRAGSRIKQSGRTNINDNQYQSVSYDPAIQQYINSFFTALAAVWFGDSYLTEIEEQINQNDMYMEVGLVYNPAMGMVIPVYKMLEQIRQGLNNAFKDKYGQLKVTYQTSLNVNDAKNFYANKMAAVRQANKNSPGHKYYPQELLEVGRANGSKAAAVTNITVVAIFLENILRSL